MTTNNLDVKHSMQVASFPNVLNDFSQKMDAKHYLLGTVKGVYQIKYYQ